MQAVEKQMPTVTSQRFIRVMAGFGMIAAAILIVVVVVSSAILVAGLRRVAAGDPGDHDVRPIRSAALTAIQVSPHFVRASMKSLRRSQRPTGRTRSRRISCE